MIHRKRTYEEFLNELLLANSSYLDDKIIKNEEELLLLPRGKFLKEKTVILVKCTTCEHEWPTNAKRMLNNQGCPKCAGKCENKDTFLKKLKEKQPEIYASINVLGEYRGTHNTILVSCKKCNHQWEPIVDNLLRGKGRCICDGGKIPKHTIESINLSLKDTTWECVSDNTFRCKNCGEILETPSKSMLTQGYNCPSCDKNARWHTAVYYENELKLKFGDDLTFEWENDNRLKKNTDVIKVFKNGEIIVEKQLRLVRGCSNIEVKNRNIIDTKSDIINNINERNLTLLTDLSDVKSQNDEIMCRCNVCGDISSYRVANVVNNTFGCRNCKYNSVKITKFSLLNEFTSEYRLREWLTIADVNIIHIILRNLQKNGSKFSPVIEDIEKLVDRMVDDPIKELEDKYRVGDKETGTETSDTRTITIEDIDLDDDDAVETVITSMDTVKREPTIDEITRANEIQLQIINEFESMLTPEDKQYLRDKFLNDKRREWMKNRDTK